MAECRCPDPVMGGAKAPSAHVAGANNRIAVAAIGVGFGIGQYHLVGIHEKGNEKTRWWRRACDGQRAPAVSPKKEKANLQDANL